MQMKHRPVTLIIRDGWGRGNEEDSNAIYATETPYTDDYELNYPTTLVRAEGLNVGLPEGSQGNSEVGHLTIGSGRINYQSLTRIDKDIKDGGFFENPTFVEAARVARERGSAVHLIGLIQEEGVHAVTHHCVALLELLKQQGISNVYVHAITDGRDTPPSSALAHLQLLQEGIDQVGIGRVATVIGRYYVMDRDNRWDRTELAYRAIMQGVGQTVADWRAAVSEAYAAGETDEFIKPRLIDYSGADEQDVMIYFNYRFDRTRQLTRAICEPDFKEFAAVKNNIHFVAMTHYYDGGNFREAYAPIPSTNLLGEVIARAGLKQLRCAETEKYAHVTFFFNGQKNDPYTGEDRILVESPKVATYDLQPEMSAYAVRDELVAAIGADTYDVIIINFANCDMVGHTGVFDAICKAVATVDECVHDVVEAVLDKGGVAILTADHGNAEQTQLADGSPMTAHTLNPVPLTIVAHDADYSLREGGGLSDIAPTLLELIGIEKPAEMSGTSLIVR